MSESLSSTLLIGWSAVCRRASYRLVVVKDGALVKRHGRIESLLASSGNSGNVVLLFMAAPRVARGSSYSEGVIGLGIGQLPGSVGDDRPFVQGVSLGFFCFGFPLRLATLYVQRRPLLTQRAHSGCCFGHATLTLEHASQANLSFCFEAGGRGCDSVDGDVVEVIMSFSLSISEDKLVVTR